MILVAHIICALSSIVISTVAFLHPSQRKVYGSYSLIGLTLASGTYLVISTKSPLLSSCLAGLTYLAFVLTATFAARAKLARV